MVETPLPRNRQSHLSNGSHISTFQVPELLPLRHTGDDYNEANIDSLLDRRSMAPDSLNAEQPRVLMANNIQVVRAALRRSHSQQLLHAASQELLRNPLRGLSDSSHFQWQCSQLVIPPPRRWLCDRCTCCLSSVSRSSCHCLSVSRAEKVISRFHWAYTNRKKCLTFGEDPVPGTDSGSLVHFYHHCGIRDFRRFISISIQSPADFHDIRRND